MTKAQPTTVYIEPELKKALKMKAAETEQKVSAIVNEAVRVLLQEDAEDLAAIEARQNEPRKSFESFLKELKRAGQI